MLRHWTCRASLVFAVIAGAMLPADALADRIRCASKDYNYAFCRVNGRVTSARVVDRHSKRACTLNRSWGWRGDGIWVNDGCDADFDVVIGGPGGPGWGGPGPGGPGWPGGRPPNVSVPSWVEGRWRAEQGRGQVEIFRNGRATTTFFGPRQEGYWSGDAIVLNNGQRLRIDRERRDRIRVYWPDGRSVIFRR